jgi:hypothetical protein
VDFSIEIKFPSAGQARLRGVDLELFLGIPLPMGSSGIIVLAENSRQNPQPKGLTY